MAQEVELPEPNAKTWIDSLKNENIPGTTLVYGVNSWYIFSQQNDHTTLIGCGIYDENMIASLESRLHLESPIEGTSIDRAFIGEYKGKKTTQKIPSYTVLRA